MTLPAPILDDLRFQRDLVDEARRRIVQYCPEWTDYNVSDPGITLIELFAWMTEQLVYRLNRVPDKLYIQFLNLLGVHLLPAVSAQTGLTMWLSTPLPISEGDRTQAIIPQGTLVATWPEPGQDEIVFSTLRNVVVSAPSLRHVRSSVDFGTEHWLGQRLDHRFYPFGAERVPRVDDAFYLGLNREQDIRGYTLQLSFACEQAAGVGVSHDDAPLQWACQTAKNRWVPLKTGIEPSEADTTGGLNNAQGSVVLYLPTDLEPTPLQGVTAYWLRCRLWPERPEQGMYARSPCIHGLDVHALGVTALARHEQAAGPEMLGLSSGEPRQSFTLLHHPLLALPDDESVEIAEGREGVFVPWDRVADFAHSSRFDRHYTLDETSGEIAFGPRVRQSDGTTRQYGRVPEMGRDIRISGYRYGGGIVGNVPAGKLRVLLSSVPYVDRVTNLHPAAGGRDAEDIEEAKLRSRRGLMTQDRAVTCTDYETLALQATTAVARAKCRSGLPSQSDQAPAVAPGAVLLLVVPTGFDPLAVPDAGPTSPESDPLRHLVIAPELRDALASYLGPRRALGGSLIIREPHYIGVHIAVAIKAVSASASSEVRYQVLDLLRQYISPLAVSSEASPSAELLPPDWSGWPFGRDVHEADIHRLLERVPGVAAVRQVLLCEQALHIGRGTVMRGTVSPHAASIRVPDDGLACLLSAEVAFNVHPS